VYQAVVAAFSPIVPTRLHSSAHGRIATEHRRHSSAHQPAESIEWLIDNADAYERLLGAIQGARRSVRIAQLALDADCVAYFHGAPAGDASSQCDRSELLVESLLATRARGASVSVLLNATLLLDTTRPLRRFLTAAQRSGIRLRGTRRFPQLQHAKIAIIDGAEAFLIGSPFVNGYWDDSRHRPVDERRPLRELGGRPLHDVSVRITGPVVADLDLMFCEMWNESAVVLGEDAEIMQPQRVRAPPSGRSGAIRLARSLPLRASPAAPTGTMEILDACLDGIDRAQSLIYIEHQYLSARPVVAALAAALAREPSLEVVLVLNQNPDITAYRVWQNARLGEWGLLDHPRVGVFTLWSTEPHGDAGRLAINQVFVHSKVIVVDDVWATAGSANLDGVSLHSYGDDFEGWLGRLIFRDVRNFEANIVVDDGIDADERAGRVADLRMRLWSEHLGMARDDLVAPPRGGWFPLWRRRAAVNVAALNSGSIDAGNPRRMHGFVLPYSQRARPAEQLADIGIDMAAARLDLCFDPGWLEVHFSPNWVRNMFL
jgi:phosphatidylserine/phosphatidylglycerophosphate/cardiolipin synthase-like enzyme